MASMSPINIPVAASGASSSGGSVSPRQAVPPKNVAFELLFPDSPQRRARLPMRVQIFPHDATDSIVTTVKNFYGLYSGPAGSKGVSFEDVNGNTLIARYENFHNNMVVYVRVIEEAPTSPAPYEPQQYQPSPIAEGYYNGNGYTAESVRPYGQDTARPESRLSLGRSPSPNASRGRRSASVNHNDKKARSRSAKNRASSQADDAMNGYSSGDGAPSSLSSKNKEQLGNTDISLENIVEGGRRKRAKFESSELPLFAPPQMPAATSNPSVSPARRIEHHRPSLPFVTPGQNPFTHPRPMQYPQYNSLSHSGMYATPVSDHRRNRGSIGYLGNGAGSTAGGNILPTPDPTVGSCMSEEDKDVAIQLMRLGEMTNMSHGRTSASTLDDTFSGKADAASSTGATSESESESEAELPVARRQKLDDVGTVKPMYQTTDAHFIPKRESVDGNVEDADYEDSVNGSTLADGQARPVKFKAPPKHKASSSMSKPGLPKALKAPRPANLIKTKKLPPVPAVPMGPMAMPAPAKDDAASVSSIQPGDDDHPDLSSKPRCQRCRKSKKGCDRQRPCGRCRDAGLSADQCVSEDEGNGRKGRYGRHMGVPIKKEDAPIPVQPTLLPAAPIAAAAILADKSKKRKR